MRTEPLSEVGGARERGLKGEKDRQAHDGPDTGSAWLYAKGVRGSGEGREGSSVRERRCMSSVFRCIVAVYSFVCVRVCVCVFCICLSAT